MTTYEITVPKVDRRNFDRWGRADLGNQFRLPVVEP